LVFGGHDKKLHLMDPNTNLEIIDEISFDGWVRCSYTIDLDGDGCDEVLIGSGDGSFLVIKLDHEAKKLVGIMRYTSSGKVICCCAGDLTNDENIELIFGGDDKTLKIFNDIDSEEPKFTLYYDSWVTACTIGLIKLPRLKKPINGLLIGTKNGGFQLIQFKNNKPDVIWQRNLNSRINCIAVGDVTNDGDNEIILGTDDSYIKILNIMGQNLRYIKVKNGRPLSLLIEDIDGDNANEIIAGCADGSLKVYHNPELESINFKLKWKTKVSTSIKDICVVDDIRNGIKHIIFGGYSRTLREITDFGWGKKPVLEIPRVIELPVLSIKNHEKVTNKIVPIPTNLKENIITILEEKGVISNLNSLLYDLIELGYSRTQIEEELELLRNQNIISYGKIDFPVWSLRKEPITEKVPVGTQFLEEMKPEYQLRVKEPSEVKFSGKKIPLEKTISEKSLKNDIVEYLKEKKIISTKTLLVNGIMEKGYSKPLIERELNLLKKSSLIQYSRSTPRGWSLASEDHSIQPSKQEIREIIVPKKKNLQKEIVNLIREKKIVVSKAELVNLIVSLGFLKKDVEKSIELLKNNKKIIYSRSAPRGWIIVEK
jgi:WD40 repeat protein